MDVTNKKIVGVMQPYFFPYFEYFRLIAACDTWVTFDTAQFSRKTWISRNRVLNRDKGTAYISVPVCHSGLQTPINKAQIDYTQLWQDRVINMLDAYRREAPNYRMVRELIGDAIGHRHESLSLLNTAVLRMICSSLNINTPISELSSMSIQLPENCEPGEWALYIAKHLGATEYRNASGGRALFDAEQYRTNGIILSFHEHSPRTYKTGTMPFVADLSIVDWMMWNDLNVLREWLS